MTRHNSQEKNYHGSSVYKQARKKAVLWVVGFCAENRTETFVFYSP